MKSPWQSRIRLSDILLSKRGIAFVYEIVDFGLDELEVLLRNCLVDVFCGLSKVFIPVSLHYFHGTELSLFRLTCLSL